MGLQIITQEPVLTWNLFWTSIIVPGSTLVLGLWIKSSWNKRELEQQKQEEEKAELLRKLEVEKEKSIKEWRSTFQDTLCLVKRSVDEIKKDISAKVDYDHCNGKHDTVKEDIDHLRDLLGSNGK